MFESLKTMLLSKKFLAMVAGLIVSFAARYGLNLSEAEVAGIVALFVAYILGQGITDSGKSAAKVEAVANVAAIEGESPRKQIAEIKNVS